jgi:hypothetical protein
MKYAKRRLHNAVEPSLAFNYAVSPSRSELYARLP